MKRIVYMALCVFISMSLISCGSSGGGGSSSPKPGKLADGKLLYFDHYSDLNTSNGDIIAVVTPIVTYEDSTIDYDYDSSAAIWSVTPSDSGTFENYPNDTSSFDPLEYGTKIFVWSGSANNVKITLELDGVKYSENIKLSDIIGYDPSSSNAGDQVYNIFIELQNTGGGWETLDSAPKYIDWNYSGEIRLVGVSANGNVYDLSTVWASSKPGLVSFDNTAANPAVLNAYNRTENITGFSYADVTITAEHGSFTVNGYLQVQRDPASY